MLERSKSVQDSRRRIKDCIKYFKPSDVNPNAHAIWMQDGCDARDEGLAPGQITCLEFGSKDHIRGNNDFRQLPQSAFEIQFNVYVFCYSKVYLSTVSRS